MPPSRPRVEAIKVGKIWVMDLALTHLANVGKPLDQMNLSCYADDVLVEFPFAPEGHTKRLEGVESLAKFLSAIADFTEGHEMKRIEVATTESGFTLRYTESSIFRSTGKHYASEIVWLAKVNDGLITHLSEFYNPLAVLSALED